MRDAGGQFFLEEFGDLRTRLDHSKKLRITRAYSGSAERCFGQIGIPRWLAKGTNQLQ